MMRRFLRFLPVVGLALSTPVLAQDYGQVKGMDERFRLDVGGFFQSFDSTIRLDSSDGSIGTEISLEDDLGMDPRKTTLRADGYWRFGRRGRLDFGYQSIRRRNERTLDRQIEWGDQVYEVGATVDTSSKIDVAELYYSYSLLNTGEAEVGLMLGVSSFFNRWSLEATGTVTGGGGGGASTVEREDAELVAPIPAIGAHLRYTLLPRLLVYGRVKWMKATVSDYTGQMLLGRAGLDLYFTPNIGIGAAWDLTDISVEKQAEKGTVEFEYKYNGPMAYVSIAF